MQTRQRFVQFVRALGSCLVTAMLVWPAAAALGETAQGNSPSPRSVRVDSVLPAGATPGEKPYQIVWSGRKEPKDTQVAFDNLAGWTMTASGDAEVGLSASVEQQLWRPQLAKLTYGGGTSDTTVEIRPPAPIDIPGKFDAANIWLFGGQARGIDKPLQIDAVVEDAAGREFVIKFAPVTITYWNIQHGLLSTKDLADARYPMKFTKLIVSNCKAAGPRAVYLESISFYQQNRNPKSNKWIRPKNPVFPVNNEGIMPTSPAGIKIGVKPASKGAEFISSGPDGVLTFTMRPEDGSMNGVTAQWNDGPVFHPMSKGRIEHDFGIDSNIPQPDESALASSTLRSGKLSVKWTQNNAGKPLTWEADYSIHGRTLVVDVRCTSGTVNGLLFGQLSGLPNPQGVEAPYLIMGAKPGPWIGCAGGLFVSVLPDFYNSDFSQARTEIEQPEGSTIGLMRGTLYEKLSDGTRNNLRDRVLVTVSPKFDETLPNAQNPVSPSRDRLAKYMLFNSGQWCPNYWSTLKDYGVDNVIATSFAQIFVRSWLEDIFTRWRPRPDVTIEQLQNYFKHIRSLGYIPGTYVCSTTVYPVNEFWDENKICTWADGTWIDGWNGAYAADPNYSSYFIRGPGKKSKELYDVGSAYLDTYTCLGLGGTYEAGAGGVGLARHNVMAIGDAILEARKWYGTTFSEGYNRWLYAGLTDMDYATNFTDSTAADKPLLVDFDLLKIHPFEIGTMMGWGPGTFLSAAEANELVALDDGRGVGSTTFHKYVSASLAYGHCLMLGYDYWPPLSRTLQYYGLFQGIQSEYLTDKATDIRYHNGTSFVTTSQMLSENPQNMGRVKVTYSRGLTVYVNYNSEKNWTVDTGDRSFELPPYGWVITKPGQILSYSALLNGNRVDYVQTPEYYYMNTGRSTATDSPIELNGAVYVKREGPGWRIIPCGDLGQIDGFHPTDPAISLWDYRFIDAPANKGCSRIAVDVKALCGNVTQVLIKSMNESGGVISSEVKQVGEGLMEFPVTAGVKEFRVAPIVKMETIGKLPLQK